MSKLQVLICLVLALVMLAGCRAVQPAPILTPDPSSTPAPPSPAALSEGQVIDIVWQALEPNTSSHNQAAWEIVLLQTVTGRQVQEIFAGDPVPGRCAPGPTPPANAQITPGGSYWYVGVQRRSVTPQPVETERYSPTAPPRIPEPFLYQAHFLVDAGTGQVVARKLDCVIY